ncbi:MAG: porin family protein [Coxiellaceae bacterium]|nr:porin family protein [Coxiellaceae bacterium]
MKKIIFLLSILTLLTTANAHITNYNPGLYLGGQVGWGRINEGDGYKQYVESQPINTVERGTFTGWRAYGGYSFVPFFSIEGGYTYYPDNTYTTTANTINIKSYTIDLVARITLPLAVLNTNTWLSHFSIYGKGGGAYINTKIDTINGIKKSSDIIHPTFGAGLVFNFTDNIALDASWTSVLGKNRISLNQVATENPTPHCNLFTLGLSYKITGIF